MSRARKGLKVPALCSLNPGVRKNVSTDPAKMTGREKVFGRMEGRGVVVYFNFLLLFQCKYY